MTKAKRLSKDDWIAAGFRALVEAGPSGLRAEAIARTLNTTKGSFYWHFPDVPGFKTAMLDLWEQRAFTDIVAKLEDEPSLPLRLRKLGQIAANAAPDGFGGVAAEPALRAWARSDPKVSQAVLRVDIQRLKYLEGLLSQMDLANPELARIIYAGLIGLEELSSRDAASLADPLGTLIDLILALK